MSSQATFLRDSTIEIQTGDGDRLILTMDETRTFHSEIEHALLSVISDDQIPLFVNFVNDVSLSIEDAEQLSARLDELLNQEGREPEQRTNWLRLGY